MSRRITTALAAALLLILAMPVAAAPSPMAPAASRAEEGFFDALRHALSLVAPWLGPFGSPLATASAAGEDGHMIDPDGVSANGDSGHMIDPNGGAAEGDDGHGIDPNG